MVTRRHSASALRAMPRSTHEGATSWDRRSLGEGLGASGLRLMRDTMSTLRLCSLFGRRPYPTCAAQC
eukprot:6978203-Alexandrium_andersonii.AAC.1